MNRARPFDTFDIPFPKTVEELAALDSDRSVPYLKALCNRRHIHTPGPNPSTSEIIPIIEQRLRDHKQQRPDLHYESDLATEWNAINADLQEFLTNLRALANGAGQGAPRDPQAHDKQASPQELPSIITPVSSVLSVSSAPSVSPPHALLEPAPPSADSDTGTTLETSGGTKAVQENPNPDPSTSSADAETEPVSPDKSAEQPLLDQVEESLSTHHPKSKRRRQKNKAPFSAAKPSSQRVIELSAGDLEIMIDLHNASPLDALPPERQQKLFQLLEDYPYRAVLRVISMPAPEGWGVKTSVASLARFVRRYADRQTAQQLKEAGQLAHELLADKDASDADILAASTRLANIRLLQVANNPNAAVRDLKDLFQIQIRLKALDLTQQRLALQKEKQNTKDNTANPAQKVNVETNSKPSINHPDPCASKIVNLQSPPLSATANIGTSKPASNAMDDAVVFDPPSSPHPTFADEKPVEFPQPGVFPKNTSQFNA